MNQYKIQIIAGLIFLSLSCSQVIIQEDEAKPLSLPEQIDLLVDDPALGHAILGVCVHSLRGDTLYEKNANTLLMPASTLKLLTTATALKTLGPHFQFSTRLYFDGAIQDSIFYGDLILRGGGDPSLVWVDSLGGVPQLQSLVRDIYALGIRKIDGRLVSDGHYFDDQPYAIGWSWENMPFYFQPEISALSINNNCVDVVVRGDSQGESATVMFTPPFPNLILTHKTRTSAASDIKIERESGNHIVVSGSIAHGTIRRTRTIHNPAQCTVALFGLMLNDAGIECADIHDIDELGQFYYNPDSTLFLDIKSPPLSDIITGINKKSKNLDAELLLKCLGAEINGVGSSESGAQVVMDVCNSFAIENTRLSIVDGSGLSRKNLVTPQSMVQVLKAMRTDSVFYNSLPMSGIDGTLDRHYWTRNRNIRAKTGTLDYVKALSGYIKTDSGDELAFSFITNHHLVDAKKISYIQNRFCQLLAQQ